MTQAGQIAKFILKLAASEDEPELITNLRLQKLLYYVQGWSLAMKGEPAFREPIEAWRHGPVVPEVYRFYSEQGARAIPHDPHAPIEISGAEQAFVASVWESYKKFSAIELANKTHRELPWLEARAGRGPRDHGDAEISQATMAQFFQAEFRKTEIPGLELESAIEMLFPSRPIRGKPLADVLAKHGLNDAASSG